MPDCLDGIWTSLPVFPLLAALTLRLLAGPAPTRARRLRRG